VPLNNIPVSPVRFLEINSGIERQQVTQHLPLFLIGLAGAAFPSQNKLRFNPHFTSHLEGMKPLFIALGLDIIAKGPYDRRYLLSAVAIQWNMGAGYANLPLCKSQQGYSPIGEGTAIAGFPFANERPANPVARIFKKTANDSPSPGGEGPVEGGYLP